MVAQPCRLHPCHRGERWLNLEPAVHDLAAGTSSAASPPSTLERSKPAGTPEQVAAAARLHAVVATAAAVAPGAAVAEWAAADLPADDGGEALLQLRAAQRELARGLAGSPGLLWEVVRSAALVACAVLSR